ncbi:MAG: VOC family protein [Rhodobacter sp.]|nr:VOC family protein [Rhodobacter sp.]
MAHLELDHIVISAERLEDGRAHVEKLLNLTLAPGGKHPDMGTHNALLNLGKTYLEVIAIDPDAPGPDHARWFDLDNFSGPPRLTHWVARTDDLAGALALAPPGTGTARALSRGDLRWKMAVPGNGKLPYDGGFPGLISWQGDVHPTGLLPKANCRLSALHITHPRGEDLRADLGKFEGGLGTRIEAGAAFGIRATVLCPCGSVTLT